MEQLKQQVQTGVFRNAETKKMAIFMCCCAIESINWNEVLTAVLKVTRRRFGVYQVQ